MSWECEGDTSGHTESARGPQQETQADWHLHTDLTDVITQPEVSEQVLPFEREWIEE